MDEASGRWQHWRERIPPWQYPAGVERPKFAQLVIPTLDSVRYEHLLGLVHSVGKATLVRAPMPDCLLPPPLSPPPLVVVVVLLLQLGRGSMPAAGVRQAATARPGAVHRPAPLPCLSPSRPAPPQLVGGPGTAKTSTIQQFLGRHSREEHCSKTITFSYLTTPGIFQQAMEVGWAAGWAAGWCPVEIVGVFCIAARPPTSCIAARPLTTVPTHPHTAGRGGEAAGPHLRPAQRQDAHRLHRRHLHARHQRLGRPGGWAGA